MNRRKRESWFSRHIGWAFDQEFWGCWIVIGLIIGSFLCSLAFYGALMLMGKAIFFGS